MMVVPTLLSRRLNGMPKRACLQCGVAFSGSGSYCPDHLHPRNANPAGRGYTSAWKKKSRLIRMAWISKYGNSCPGTPWCDSPNVAHYSIDLTVEHSDGTVMCRKANSRKGGGFDRLSAKPKGGNRVVDF